MTTTTADIEYDPYDPAISANPFEVFRRLRDDVPLYYNERLDFFALSRFDDVERAFVDRRTYINGRGDVLEAIQSNTPVPPGFFIFEDPPVHTVHRGVLSRSFTPKRMSALEPEIRRFCAEALDPLVGGDRIDFVRDLGARIPMRVISKLLGIPEADQETVRDRADEHVRTEPGKPRDYAVQTVTGEEFADYIDWRVDHPSDDMMTELINAEFEDETGTVRSLTREEILVYTNLLATAGNETTNRLIGWSAKVLSDHPDQRRALLDEPALVANAVEEVLRYEPTGLHIARYVARDVELHDRVVPEGSAMLLLAGAANRDERHYPDAGRFDVRRRIDRHFTFAYGAHFCLGAALARLEGRIALEEVLKRFRDWEVDLDEARFAATSTVRGWETLPAVIQ
jgi:cytochrome P450